MAAGIVASTLRRRTFRHKVTLEARYQVIDPGHISLSPTGSHPPSRSPSFLRADLSRTNSDRSANCIPKGTRLLYHDFWPKCVNPAEQNVKLVQFETFDTLVPKANAWLTENSEIHLVKSETIEKKISSVDEISGDSPLYKPKGDHAIYLKGLRLWYIRERDADPTKNKTTTGGDATMKGDAKNNSDGASGGEDPGGGGTGTGNGDKDSMPIEIGYMNVIPKCLDSILKYPVYENLTETYAAVNTYLSESPLEGKILTIETVPLKLPRRHWDGPEVDPDQTYFTDEYLRHVLYITRIYFIYGSSGDELIGAQDFLPDFLGAPRWYSLYGIYPKYTNLISAMQKVKIWMKHIRHIRVTNIQTLEVVFRGHPDQVETGVNFVEKVESAGMVRFVRVTYVRPQNPSPDVPACYTPPTGFSYKTFVPSAVKVGMCSGDPEYEDFQRTWDRARTWLKIADKNVIGAETFYHPVSKVWHSQDGGETTVLHGEWTTTHRGEKRHKRRRPLVHVVRVYLDGDYTEPPMHRLPPTPGVEEYNDCKCTIL